MEPGFIRKLRDVKHSWRIVKEVPQPLAVATLLSACLVPTTGEPWSLCVVEALLFLTTL